jgi:hypothetical protein
LPLMVRVGSVVSVLSQLHQDEQLTHLLSHEETGTGWSYVRDQQVAAWCQLRIARVWPITTRQFGSLCQRPKAAQPNLCSWPNNCARWQAQAFQRSQPLARKSQAGQVPQP